MATTFQLKSMLTTESETGPFISIGLPFSKQDHLPGLIQSARYDFLKEHPADQWSDYQNKLKHFDLPKVHSDTESLAIYIGPTLLRVFKLNYPIKTNYFISNTMKIVPLLIDIQRWYYQSTNKLSKEIQKRYRTAEQNKNTSYDLNRIIVAAPAGLIDTLIINSSVTDPFNPTVNDLAITTIGFDGKVALLPQSRMPSQSRIAIINRISELNN